MSPTGARTYEIPITTASGCQLVPDVSLVYNSQPGNGVAGYGWNVAGGSAITVVPKSIHYDGEVSTLNLADPTTCAFSLDGTRLVRNIGQPADYQYETAQGFILVKAHKSGRAVAYFTVAYPNGNTATFGFTDNHSQVMQPVYPITELHDQHGNRIDFSYTESGGCLYLAKISYGGRSADSHQAEIAFNYTDRTDVTTTYVGGKAMRADRLLESIASSDVVGGKNTNICLCMLNHEEDEVNRLVSMNYVLGDKSLPGISFEYGAGEKGKMLELTKKEGLAIMKYYSKGYDINPVYIRGKLVAGSYSDGILTLPGCYDTYIKVREHVVGKVRIPVYGSGYPANQGILIAPRLSMYSHVDSIYTESGFQAIQAVDVDGDGTDEIVKINFAGASKNSTSFKVSVYGNGGSITTPQTFTFSIGKSLDAGANTYSPAQCAYMWGDFRGDGKVQLLLTAYTPNEEKSLFMYLVVCNIGMNAFGLLNGLFGGKITFDKNNLTAVYTGGLIDNMYPPEESVDAVGFSPFVVTGNSKLHSDLNTFEHEVHHLWHSRVFGERYFINYGLQGIAAWLQNCSFLEKMNFYETIAYNRFWW